MNTDIPDPCKADFKAEKPRRKGGLLRMQNDAGIKCIHHGNPGRVPAFIMS